MSEVANQLKSQTLDEVISTSFNTVGGRVFPDLNASLDILDLVKIVDSWRATHAQTYGNPIPDTGTSYSVSPSSTDTPTDLVAAANNEVIHINGISLRNGGAGLVGFQIRIGDVLLSTGQVPPGEDLPVQDIYQQLIISKGQTLTITATSGTATDLTAFASGVKCSQ